MSMPIRMSGARTLRLRPHIAAVLAVMVALGACTVDSDPDSATSQGGGEPRTGGSLTVAATTEFTSLDPTADSLNVKNSIAVAIYDTLMIVPERGEAPEPNIAESMEVSDDGLTWTMTLPVGLTFSDDTPFDAEAVKFNIERGMAEGTITAAALASVESVEAVDDTTVAFHLREPFANFPYVLAYDGSGTAGYIASPTALQKYGEKYSQHAAGAGPYMVESWSPGEPVELVRNPNYWNADDHKPYLDRVTVRVIEDPQSQLQALQAGDVDLMVTGSTAVMQAAAGDAALEVVPVEGNTSQYAVVPNLAKAPFDDLRIRHALSKAIDRDELVALTSEGYGAPAVNLFPADHVWANDNAQPGFDPDGATDLIEEYESETGREAEFSYSCLSTNPANDVILNQLEEAGFTVTADIVDNTTWVTNFFGGNYDASCWLMSDFLIPDLLPYRYFHSKGDLNTGGYANPEYDDLVEQARGAADPVEQQSLWAEADAIITGDLPWVWTASNPIATIRGPRVQSVDFEEPSRLRSNAVMFLNAWVTD